MTMPRTVEEILKHADELAARFESYEPDPKDELDAKAVLLLNVDAAAAGNDLDLDGIPSLRDLVLDAAGAVTDVRSGKTLREVWLARRRAAWGSGRRPPSSWTGTPWRGRSRSARSARGCAGCSRTARRPEPSQTIP